MISEMFLFQMVREPTFRNNILDLVITDEPERIVNIKNLPPLGSIEGNGLHVTLSWLFRTNELQNKPESSMIKVYNKCNFAELNNHFLTRQWQNTAGNLEISLLNNKFLDEYNKAIDLFVPTVKLNGRLTGLELALKKNLEIRQAQKNKYKRLQNQELVRNR